LNRRDTAASTPDARPAWLAIRGKTAGFGSTQTPDQPSFRSKYHVFE
jgi:hypothetical protein